MNYPKQAPSVQPGHRVPGLLNLKRWPQPSYDSVLGRRPLLPDRPSPITGGASGSWRSAVRTRRCSTPGRSRPRSSAPDGTRPPGRPSPGGPFLFGTSGASGDWPSSIRTLPSGIKPSTSRLRVSESPSPKVGDPWAPRRLGNPKIQGSMRTSIPSDSAAAATRDMLFGYFREKPW